MTGNSSSEKQNRGLDEIVEDEPQSKRGKQGQAKHDHERAGPNSDAYGQTIAPQKGELRSGDRARGS